MFWFYLLLLDYDVSMHKVVELVVMIPTSQRSSKSESGCNSSSSFRKAVLVFIGWPVVPPQMAGTTGGRYYRPKWPVLPVGGSTAQLPPNYR